MPGLSPIPGLSPAPGLSAGSVPPEDDLLPQVCHPHQACRLRLACHRRSLRSEQLLRTGISQRSRSSANANLAQIRESFSTLLGKIQKLLKLTLARSPLSGARNPVLCS